MAQLVQVVLLQVHAAHGLGKADADGSSDPYCVMFWNNREAGQTSVIYDTLDPEWTSERFAFVLQDAEQLASGGATAGVVREEGAELRVEVYDHDDHGRGDFLGQVIFGQEQLDQLSMQLL